MREEQATLAGTLAAENLAMQFAAHLFRHPRRYEAAQKLARQGQRVFERKGQLGNLPGMAGEWTRLRDLRPLPSESFREWWKKRAEMES